MSENTEDEWASTEQEAPKYAGFWVRTGASIIDTVLLLLIISPALYLIYGPAYWSAETTVMGVWDVLLNHVLPAVAIILFWMYRSATPGKMMLDLKIVHAENGQKPSNAQFIGRYFAYYVALIPLMLGIIWVAFDKRKQGWHDKLAGTVVIHDTDFTND